MRSKSPLPSPERRAADKRVPILTVIAALGISICGMARGGNYYCLSPFRDERTPSLVVSEPKNCWIDFGEVGDNNKPAGGDVLALVMRFFRVELPQARVLLQELTQHVPAPLPELAPAGIPAAAGAPAASLHDVQHARLSHPVLINYLRGRGINWGLLQGNEQLLASLQQVTYHVAGKPRPRPYFSLAWQTLGGYELRNAGFQGTLGNKGLTYFQGRQPGCLVFEGFMDYLSALTYYGRSSFRCSVLVLNSVNLIAHALPYLAEEPVVYWFGDNDKPGEKALTFLRERLPPGRIQTRNELYRGYTDFNDFLTRTPPRKPLPAHRAEPSTRSLTARWWIWVVFDEQDKARSRRTGRVEYKQCTFYSYTNDEAGHEALLLLRHQLQHQWRYYRFCERTTGSDFRILDCAGIADERPRPAAT